MALIGHISKTEVSANRLLSCRRFPDTEVKNKIMITTVVCIVKQCHESTLAHTVSYLVLYLFWKQKAIKDVRKKRTQLTVRVVEIAMEMR